MKQLSARARRAALPIMCCAALGAAIGCAGVHTAQFDHEIFTIKNVCKIRFGAAGVNWWLLQAGVSSVDVTPEPGAQLQGATLRVFEDANGNGAFDTGEKQKSFGAVSGPNGLSFSNVQVSAGDVANWNSSHVQCSVEVTDASGGTHVWTHPL